MSQKENEEYLTLEERLLRLQQAQQELEKSISSLESYVQDLGSRLNAIHRLSTPSPQIKDNAYPRVLGGIQRSDKIKVFIVDEKALYRQGLRFYLSQIENVEVIGECDHYLEDTVSMVEELGPDMILVDINLPSFSGFDLVQQITQRSPNMPIILLTSHEDDSQIFEAIRLGVAGYLSSDTAAERLASAIRRVADGHRIINNLLARPNVAELVLNQFQDTVKAMHLSALLTLQENEILRYFIKGYSVTDAAHILTMSEEEIKTHMANIVSKLIANERRRGGRLPAS